VTFDLALAAAVLSADRRVPSTRLEKTVLLGELALDGRVRPVRGVLPAVLAAKREGWLAVVVPVSSSPRRPGCQSGGSIRSATDDGGEQMCCR
jgi:predicted ATPase with chaperone activity